MKKLIIGMAIASFFLAACNNKASVTTGGSDSTAAYLKMIKQTALSTDSAFNKKDVDAMFKNCAPGFVDYGNGTGKPMTNADTIKAGLKSFFASFPDFKGEDFQAVAEDSTVIVTGTFSGTFKSDYMKIKATNKSYKAFDADIFTFNKAGKMTSHKSIQSDATLFYQLGIPMPPAPKKK